MWMFVIWNMLLGIYVVSCYLQKPVMSALTSVFAKYMWNWSVGTDQYEAVNIVEKPIQK